MIRKTIGVMLAVFMAVTCLGGCSGEDGSSTEPVHTGSGKKPEAHTLENTAEGSGEHRSSGSESATTVLKWAVWDLRTAPYWQAIADSYTAEHEDVRIEMEDLGSADYQTVLAKELSEEETEFDIVSMKDVPGYASLVSKGMLEPLSERAAADGLDLAAFNGTAEQVTVKGILYEMPFRSDFWLLYYNKDLFDDAGVDYPTNDMTIKEYDELARAAAGTDSSGSHIYGAHYHTWRSAVQLFGILDGQHSVLDGSYDFTEEYYEMVRKQEEDGICRRYVDLKDSRLHYSAAFSEGNTATMNMGSWYISMLMSGLAGGEYREEDCGNWGIVKYPHPDGVEAGTTLGTITGLSIPQSSGQKEEAWDFIKYACSLKGAEVLAKTGTFPAIMSDSVVEILTGLAGFPADAGSREALKTAKIYLEAPYDENISRINTILDVYHDEIMDERFSIEDGIAKMNEEVGAVLDKQTARTGDSE